MSDGSDAVKAVGVICGPTAAGKSAVAMELARRHGCAIVVADSRQVYRRFDIGTAKPTHADRRAVEHVAIDLIDPTERFSAARWAEVADGALTIETDGGQRPIVVGGTGMYLRALFDGLFAEPEMDAGRRSGLLAWLDSLSTDELRRWTSALDPDRAAFGRTQLLRAVEVALLSGLQISRLHIARATKRHWRAEYLVVDPGPALHPRIASRLDDMIDAGWVDEVRSLADVPDDAPAWNASGYQTMRDVARGTTSIEEARERVLIETRQYAKRQRTWFRNQLPADRTLRVNPEESDATAVIDAWWNRIAAT